MKIYLADPHPEVRSALHLVLERMPGMVVSGGAGDWVQLLEQCAQECPDLILFDMELGNPYAVHRRQNKPSLASIIRLLRKICPRAMLVVMSILFGAEHEALACGADGFVSKLDPPEVFWKNINTLVQRVPKEDSHTKLEGKNDEKLYS